MVILQIHYCVFKLSIQLRLMKFIVWQHKIMLKFRLKKPLYTSQVDGIGTLNILEAIRNSDIITKTKFYQASTSELYGLVQQVPQTERLLFLSTPALRGCKTLCLLDGR
jgi:hypothetical protein